MIRFSCALPPNAEAVELGCLPVQVGYRRVWCYDLIVELVIDGMTEVVLRPGGFRHSRQTDQDGPHCRPPGHRTWRRRRFHTIGVRV